LPRRAACALAAAFSAAAGFGCVSFPGYPLREDETLLRELAPLAGSVRVRTSFELLLNGSVAVVPPLREKSYEEAVAAAYRASGLFDRVAEGREPTDLEAEVEILGLAEMNRPWVAVAALTLFTLPAVGRSEAQVATVLRRADTGEEVGRSHVCSLWRDYGHVTLLPFVFSHAQEAVMRDVLFGLSRKGLVLAAAGERGLAASPRLAAAARSSCPATARLPRMRAPRDARSRFAAELERRDEGPCLRRPSVETYLAAALAKLRQAWRPPEAAVRDTRVELHFSLDAEGRFLTLEVPAEVDTWLADSAVAAAHDAAPFPPLAGPLACLVGEPITASFSEPPDRP
jgi:hypothetical protein